MGLFSLNPAQIITTIKDDDQKRAAESLALNLAWSGYITALYKAGQGIKGKPVVGWFSDALIGMACSALTLIKNERNFKLIGLAVPKEMQTDLAMQGIAFTEIKEVKS